ncbi:MAG: RNA polymerase sigma factor [bacterium]
MNNSNFTKELYETLWGYFKYLYYKKQWYSSFGGNKNDDFIRDLFHGALIKNSRLEREDADIEKMLAPFGNDLKKLKFPNEKAHKAYLALIFQNYIIDLIRAKAAKKEICDENIEEKESGENSLDTDLINDDLKNIAIKLAGSEFNREERLIISLYFNKGMTYASVGKSVGRSLSAVERRMKKTFLKIQTFIERETSSGNYSDDDRTAILSYFLHELKVEFEKDVKRAEGEIK